MKECISCRTFFKESVMRCQRCGGDLKEITLSEALIHTRKKFLRHFTKIREGEISDPHTQYVVSSYFNNHTLFLFFDLGKNQLKYGRGFDRFFIQPVNCTAFINIPWFFFNLLYTNYFHVTYTEFCPRCSCKHQKGRHSAEDCEYNIVYFRILCDVLNGEIIHTRKVYEHLLLESTDKGAQRAYKDLTKRNKGAEGLLDFLSIGFSISAWMYLGVYVSYPMAMVLFQMI